MLLLPTLPTLVGEHGIVGTWCFSSGLHVSFSGANRSFEFSHAFSWFKPEANSSATQNFGYSKLALRPIPIGVADSCPRSHGACFPKGFSVSSPSMRDPQPLRGPIPNQPRPSTLAPKTLGTTYTSATETPSTLGPHKTGVIKHTRSAQVCTMPPKHWRCLGGWNLRLGVPAWIIASRPKPCLNSPERRSKLDAPPKATGRDLFAAPFAFAPTPKQDAGAHHCVVLGTGGEISGSAAHCSGQVSSLRF